jgi:ribosomal protein S18 acetylase RimI-like enzyme
MLVSLNDLETRRFGVICARVDCQAAEFPNLREVDLAAQAQGVALISTRVNVGAIDRVHALEANGYRLMDALVYYRRSLADICRLPSLLEGITVRVASPADTSAVVNVARQAFRGYIGHYHADPRLDTNDADAAYVQWAESSVTSVNDSHPVLIILKKGELVGFATLRIDSSREVEILLNAIHPDHQRGGLYSHLLEQTLNFSAKRGAQLIMISTQINNYATQRVWTRAGFEHYSSVYTFHKWYNYTKSR